MPRRIDKTALAEQDLDNLAVYYLREAGIVVTRRFLRNAEHAFTHLANMPQMGALVGFTKPEQAGIRRWHIQGFPRLLILYRANPDGIEVIRVVDAGRDIIALLADADCPLT